MSTSAERIQVFYEIAMSIGSTMDLRALVRDALRTYLRKLNASAGSVLRRTEDETGRSCLEKIHSTPRRIESLAAYRIACDAALEGKLPAIGRSLHDIDDEGTSAYVFELPRFGVLVLMTRTQRFDPHILHSLSQLNAKLADACLACVRNEQLEQAQRRAEAATRAKSELLANVSHELRTPMGSILGIADLLGDTRLDQDQQEMVHTITSSATDLLAIINDILDLSKVEADRLELDEVAFELPEQLRKVDALVGHQAREKGLSFDYELAPGTPRALWGDPGRLRQILVNLAGNAVKFTDHGRVEIRGEAVSTDDQRVQLRFEVRDTGIGIPPERLGAVFRPFSQVDPSTSRRYPGTGLGLTICRRLVGLMGGEIGVHSESGRGSTFWFTVRLLRSQESPDAETVASSSHARDAAAVSRDATILLVEDNAIAQSVMTRMLEKAGLRVRAANDGHEALRALDDEVPDLVLMDCQMPRMDGYEATRRIRERRGEERRVPIIALTANAMKEDRQRCMDAGMDDFLSKPIKRDELWGAVDQWLERASSSQ